MNSEFTVPRVFDPPDHCVPGIVDQYIDLAGLEVRGQLFVAILLARVELQPLTSVGSKLGDRFLSFANVSTGADDFVASSERL